MRFDPVTMLWTRFLQPMEDTVLALLKKGKFTLLEMMDQSDFLQSLRIREQEFLNYLARPDTILELLGLVVDTPDASADENRRYKYPYLACEVLSEDCPQLTDVLVGSRSCLDRLFGFFAQQPPVSALLANYVHRIFFLLFQKKTAEILAQMEARSVLRSILAGHIAVYPFSTIVVAWWDAVEKGGNPAGKAALAEWARAHGIVDQLIGLLGAEHAAMVRANSQGLLCDLFGRFAANPRPLVEIVLQPRHIERLFEIVLGTEKHSATMALTVLRELFVRCAALEPPPEPIIPRLEGATEAPPPGAVSGMPGTTGSASPASAVSPQAAAAECAPQAAPLYSAMLHMLPALVARVRIAPPDRAVTVWREVNPRMGLVRIAALDLMSAIARVPSSDVWPSFRGGDALPTVVELLFGFPDNNICHHHITTLLLALLTSADDVGRHHILINLGLAKRCAELLLASEHARARDPVTAHAPLRGSAIQLLNKAIELSPSGCALSQALSGVDSWEAVVEVVKREISNQTSLLGGMEIPSIDGLAETEALRAELGLDADASFNPFDLFGAGDHSAAVGTGASTGEAPPAASTVGLSELLGKAMFPSEFDATFGGDDGGFPEDDTAAPAAPESMFAGGAGSPAAPASAPAPAAAIPPPSAAVLAAFGGSGNHGASGPMSDGPDSFFEDDDDDDDEATADAGPAAHSGDVAAADGSGAAVPAGALPGAGDESGPPRAHLS